MHRRDRPRDSLLLTRIFSPAALILVVDSMYLFDSATSCEGCLPTDKFTLVNAGYLGAIDTAINELGLTLGMSASAAIIAADDRSRSPLRLRLTFFFQRVR